MKNLNLSEIEIMSTSENHPVIFEPPRKVLIGNDLDSGNFTQIIWKSTKYLGVAAATNDTYNEVYLVCMYDPPGNIVEDYQDNLDLDLLIPELEAGVAPPEKLDVSVRLRINLCLMLVIIIPVWNILHC